MYMSCVTVIIAGFAQAVEGAYESFRNGGK